FCIPESIVGKKILAEVGSNEGDVFFLSYSDQEGEELLVQRAPETEIVSKKSFPVEHPFRFLRAVLVEPGFTDRYCQVRSFLPDFPNQRRQPCHLVFGVELQGIQVDI